MKYVSTRMKPGDRAPRLTFSECLTQGLAPDGGLYVPEALPSFSENDIASFAKLPTLADFSAAVLKPFLAESTLAAHLDSICHEAMNFEVPLRFLSNDPSTAILELFHGPTAAFKDVGARFLASCQAAQSTPSAHSPTTVIVATSGDTGGAVAAAFSGRPGFQVVILYPKGKISARQEKQLTNWGPTVRAFAVHGSFDDCQRLVKSALSDPSLSQKYRFISANSISIGRLLPQMCYHAKASVDFQTKTSHRPTLIVPTGNLGNAVAALWAKRVGFPIGRVVLATNANRTLIDYFENGRYEIRPAIPTLANAMDVSAPSNFERLQHLYPDLHFLKQDVTVVSVTDDEIREVIRADARDCNQTWCPHTATAVVAKRKTQTEHAILCATAHPAKFETIVEPLIGKTIEVPPRLASTLRGESHSQDLPADYAAFVSAL